MKRRGRESHHSFPNGPVIAKDWPPLKWVSASFLYSPCIASPTFQEIVLQLCVVVDAESPELFPYPWQLFWDSWLFYQNRDGCTCFLTVLLHFLWFFNSERAMYFLKEFRWGKPKIFYFFERCFISAMIRVMSLRSFPSTHGTEKASETYQVAWLGPSRNRSKQGIRTQTRFV